MQRLRVASALLLGLLLGGGAFAQEMNDMTIIETAPERIREHRTGELAINVVNNEGKPVAGAEVSVRQTRHEFFFGCNIFGWHQTNEADAARYRDQFAALLNYATLPFYWGSFEPQKGHPSYARIDPMLEWCLARNIATKGHPLVWNHRASTPKWLSGSAMDVFHLSNTRVYEIVRRYAGRIDIWDVVNEATDPFRKGGDFDGAVTEAWKMIGQIPFAAAPFEIVREQNPKARLLINDYRTDAAYEKIVEQLKDADGRRLYDIIGIQSHMHGGAWKTRKIWDVCERFARFGVPLHFTETTIVSGQRAPQGWNTTPEGEAAQAEETARFYTVLFSHPAVQAITWWDFADRGAWQGAPAGFLRKDLSPKPVYDRLMNLIKGEWWTNTNIVTDAQGRCAARAFYGDYEIKARSGGKETPVMFRFTGAKEHSVTVTLK